MDDPKWRIPGSQSTNDFGTAEAAVWRYDPNHDCLVRPQTAPPVMTMPPVNLEDAAGGIDEIDKAMLIRNGIFTVISHDSTMSRETPGGHEVVLPSVEEIIGEMWNEEGVDMEALVGEGMAWQVMFGRQNLVHVVDEEEEVVQVEKDV